MYSDWSRFDDAEPLYNQVLTAQRAKRGPDHPDTLDTMASLAQLYHHRREFGRAEALCKQVLSGRRARWPRATPISSRP